MASAAVIHLPVAGNARMEMAIGSRNSEENGFSMPPLKPIIHVSTTTSTARCAMTSTCVASRGRVPRQVA